MSSPRTRFYRDPYDGKLMGVCAGIADYAGVNVLWVRLAAILLVVMGFGLLIPAYLAAGLLTAKKPPQLYRDGGEQRFWQSVRQSPKRTARDVRAQLRVIDHRLADIEEFYVGNNRRLSAEIERLR